MGMVDLDPSKRRREFHPVGACVEPRSDVDDRVGSPWTRSPSARTHLSRPFGWPRPMPRLAGCLRCGGPVHRPSRQRAGHRTVHPSGWIRWPASRRPAVRCRIRAGSRRPCSRSGSFHAVGASRAAERTLGSSERDVSRTIRRSRSGVADHSQIVIARVCRPDR